MSRGAVASADYRLDVPDLGFAAFEQRDSTPGHPLPGQLLHRVRGIGRVHAHSGLSLPVPGSETRGTGLASRPDRHGLPVGKDVYPEILDRGNGATNTNETAFQTQV